MVNPSLETVSWGFIVVGIVLLLVEAASPGFFIAIPGTILIIIGLFAYAIKDAVNAEALFTLWAPIIAIAVGVPATAITVWAYRRIAPANGPPTTVSSDALVGKRGQVTRAVTPGSTKGKVRVENQIWSATSAAAIPEGAEVEVVEVKGVTLTVKPMEG